MASFVVSGLTENSSVRVDMALAQFNDGSGYFERSDRFQWMKGDGNQIVIRGNVLSATSFVDNQRALDGTLV